MSPSAIDNAPPGPKVPLFSPAATDCQGEVLNVGHEIKRLPPARVPSALYTSSLMVVVAGVCDDDTAAASSK